jgi:hypothetical protein
VVGSIPEAEREYFDELPDCEERNGYRDWPAYSRWPTELLRTSAIIEKDIQTLYPASKYDWGLNTLEKKHTGRGRSPRGGELHFDMDIGRCSGKEITYLISNKLTTLFYGGQVKLNPRIREDGTVYGAFSSTICLDEASLDTDSELISGPPYAILRLAQLGIHASPFAEEPTTRTFMRVTGVAGN